jgi:hypothetical protein
MKGKEWTKNELFILATHGLYLTDKALRRLLPNRTVGAIYQKRMKLGLYKNGKAMVEE